MIKQVFIITIALAVIGLLLMYTFQRQFIYFPTKNQPSRKLFHANDMEQLRLKTRDGLDLNAWYKPAAEKKPTLLYLHGNAGHIGYRMPLVRQFLNVGLGVLLLDYRGYGGNKGQPTEAGLYADGRAAIDFLQQRGIPSTHWVLYGESLGTAVATKLATEYPVCALILQSPFTSLASLARYHYPWIFMRPWDKFDSLSRIAATKAPLLILHGREDQIVPFAQGLTLYSQANLPKQFIPFANRGHNDLWNAAFAEEIIHFIATHCPTSSG